MKHFWLVLCLLVGIGISTSAMLAEGNKSDLSDAQKSQLTEVMYGLLAIQDLQKEEIITKNQWETATKVYLKRAQKIAPGYGSLEKMITIQGGNFDVESTGKLTFLQKVAGLVTMVNILWTIAIVIGVICFMFLFGDMIVTIAGSIPPIFYETILYLFSLGIIWYGVGLSPSVSPWVGFTGCLLLGAFTISTNLHGKFSAMFTFFVLFVVYSGVAILYMSSLIGFIAIIALMGALGFSVGMTPGCIFLGFEDEDAVGKATTAGFIVLTIYCVTRILGFNNEYLAVFQSGALFMGSFVGYLGLLIASSRWYKSNHLYPVMQLITIIAGILAIVVGSIWHIGELQKIGGTFFVIYILEKMMEIPMQSMRGYAFLGLAMSTFVYMGSASAKTHMHIFGPYLPF